MTNFQQPKPVGHRPKIISHMNRTCQDGKMHKFLKKNDSYFVQNDNVENQLKNILFFVQSDEVKKFLKNS